MKKVKYMAVSMLFCLVLIGCGKFFRYILIDDTASYTRITFHEMYEQDNIDILFVGSSHCYRSFIPEIFDKELGGVNSFNVGSSSQALDGSYVIIKEAVKYYDIKHIYLELFYNVAFGTYKNRTEMTQTYIISDYLRPSLDKVQYLLKASANDYYLNGFIVARRNWTKFFDADYVRNLIIKKGTDEYKNYEYTYVTGELEWYAGKGYVANKTSIENGDYFFSDSLSNIHFENISEDWCNSLEDIIAFCNEMNIKLTLISVPMPNYLLADVGNYDEYVKFVQQMVAGTGVNYYDFNLCKEEYFPNTSLLFMDNHHMNCYGAEKFSYLLCDFIKGEISEEELFYDSYEEKLENLEPTVFGISYHDNKNDNGKLVRKCKIVSTGNDNLQYEISLSPTEGEPYKLQDFSDNEYFIIMPEEHGVITVAYRLNNLPDKKQMVYISY